MAAASLLRSRWRGGAEFAGQDHKSFGTRYWSMGYAVLIIPRMRKILLPGRQPPYSVRLLFRNIGVQSQNLDEAGGAPALQFEESPRARARARFVCRATAPVADRITGRRSACPTTSFSPLPPPVGEITESYGARDRRSNQAIAGTVVQTASRAVNTGWKRHCHGRLQVVRRCRPAALIPRLESIILPIVIRRDERSSAVAQSRVGLASTSGTPTAARLGPNRELQFYPAHRRGQGSTPAMTMSSTVLTKARVLILAVSSRPPDEVVGFDQAA